MSEQERNGLKQSKKWSTQKLTTNAILIALHLVLCQIATIQVGGIISITVSGITEVVAGLLFGPISGGTVGIIGSLLNQLLKYGFSATTVLWIIPAGLKGLLCGWFAKSRRYQMNPLEIFWVLEVTAVIVTAVNTNVMVIDAEIFGYKTNATVVAQMGLRYLSGLVTSLAYMAVTAPLLARLNRLPGIQGMRE